jgi:hypothetical protein
VNIHLLFGRHAPADGAARVGEDGVEPHDGRVLLSPEGCARKLEICDMAGRQRRNG